MVRITFSHNGSINVSKSRLLSFVFVMEFVLSSMLVTIIDPASFAAWIATSNRDDSSSSLSVEVVFVDVVAVVSAALCIVNDDIGQRRDLDASVGANAYDGDDESSVTTTTESSVVDVVKIMGGDEGRGWREEVLRLVW